MTHLERARVPTRPVDLTRLVRRLGILDAHADRHEASGIHPRSHSFAARPPVNVTPVLRQ
jgi:hypothetical protein